MPIYSYKCINNECSQKDIVTDVLMSLNNKDNPLCDYCYDKMERVIVPFAGRINGNFTPKFHK